MFAPIASLAKSLSLFVETIFTIACKNYFHNPLGNNLPSKSTFPQIEMVEMAIQQKCTQKQQTDPVNYLSKNMAELDDHDHDMINEILQVSA